MRSISPEKVFRGTRAWIKALPLIKQFSERPLLLGRSLATSKIRHEIYKDLLEENLEVQI